jgi:hypothetical protein
METLIRLLSNLPEAKLIQQPLHLLHKTFSQKNLSRTYALLTKKSCKSVLTSHKRARTPAHHPSVTKHSQFTLEGILKHGTNTLFAINGIDLITTNNTWIFGELTIGCHAKVKGIIKQEDKKKRFCISIIASPLVSDAG